MSPSEFPSSGTGPNPKRNPSGSERLWDFVRSRGLLLMGGAIAVALLVHFGLAWAEARAPVTIEYSTFLDYVESGYIERVDIINGTTLEGTYTVDAMQQDAVELPPENGNGAEAIVDGPRRAFRTTKPRAHELTAFLRQYNDAAADAGRATVTFTARQEEDWGGILFRWGLPLGLLLGIWFFFVRRMSAGSQQWPDYSDNAASLFEESPGREITFDDVAGLQEAKAEVREVVEFLRTPEKFTRLGGALPTGVLLVGPPGTGKTLLAKAVAGEAGVPFFSISGSDFTEMFVGVGASRVRDLFESAKEKAPCIIFIDEMDAIGRTRGRGQVSSGNDERDSTLNQLLVEMDGFDSEEGVVIMGATNRPDVLDSALLRPGRFDRQVAIHKPDRREREEIFRVHVQNLLLDETVDLSVLARQTPGFAGAEIENICNEAALLAARTDKSAIQMEDFEQAIERVIAGLKKRNKLIAPADRKVIAYHEAGHAIVGWFAEHTDPVVKVSIVPRGVSGLGYAQHLPEERDLYSKAALLDRMTMALGGRVAEAVALGDVTTGAQDDLERVTNMAHAMVVDYGMSERLGPISYNRSRRDDEGPMVSKPYSEATAEIIDKEVKTLIDKARSRARTLLREKKSLLEDMAEALIQEEVLASEDLVELLGMPPHGEYPRTPETGQPKRTPASECGRREKRDGSSSESGPTTDSSETTEKPAS